VSDRLKMSGEQRRPAAVMFAGIVGYSARSPESERLALELLEGQKSMILPIAARYSGQEIEATGGSFLFRFRSALEAAQCAIDVQRGLQNRNRQGAAERSTHVRIGIHLEGVSQDEVRGGAVEIASGIERLAEPDGICVSQQVFDQIANKIGCRVVSIGPQHLENVKDPVNVYKILLIDDPMNLYKTLLHQQKRETAQADLDINSSVSPSAKYESFGSGLMFTSGRTAILFPSRISTIGGLKVIARTSIMRFRGTTKGVGEIGRELRVGVILEGSVRKAADRLRVAVQLVDVGSEEHLWVESYDRQLEDVFAIQTEVASSVAEALKMRLLKGEKE